MNSRRSKLRSCHPEFRLFVYLSWLFAASVALATAADLEVEHKFVENEGVKIHYAAAGKGPLVVFIHGFPDFWYSWHHQMKGLQDAYRVVALDTRGYNKSDKPDKQEAYDLKHLVADVAAVIEAEKRERATIVGHDWGGAIAWRFAMTRPAMTKNLIIVNSPHPKGIMRELANNPEQRKSAQYARDFQKPDSHLKLNAMVLAGVVTRNPLLYPRYLEALKNSSLEGMMHYYRQNYPREPYQEMEGDPPKITAPVLLFHGLEDSALHHHGLNKTWEWVGRDFTLVTIPGVGHWSHHEAAELVTDTMRSWLKKRH